MEKRSRPDIAEKKKARKDNQETVVKCSLNRLLLGDAKDSIADAIKGRVQSCSHRYFKASIALNLLVRQLFDGKDDVQSVNVPEFWDTTFVRQLMLGTASARAKEPLITSLFENYQSLLSTTDRHLGDRNIYSFAAIKLATNIKNHLRVNLERLLKKYFYDFSGLDKDLASDCIKYLCKWTKKTIDDKKALHHLQIVQTILDTATISASFIKSDSKLANILRFFVFMNRMMEKAKLPLYNILPICKIKSHFITIDTSVFKGILQEVNILKDHEDDVLDIELWESIFDIPKIKGKAKEFTRTIDTDGYAINVHFTKRKDEKMKNVVHDPKTMDFKGKRVLGVDPGRSNVYTIAEDIGGGMYKKYTLTRKQFYTESGINKANKLSEKWNQGIKKELALLSEHSPKSASLIVFEKYIKALLSIEKKLWKEYTKSRWQEQRFRLYGGKKRVFARFFNKLGDPKNTVLAYGSAKFAPGGKNEVAVPVGRAYQEATYRFETVLVDEFRTSKVNWKTLDVLDQVITKKKDKLIPIRGLLWCSSTNEFKGKFVDRDLNAAINILRCVMLPRPRILDRKYTTGKIVQRIGKII
jgi:hypothetical protein